MVELTENYDSDEILKAKKKELYEECKTTWRMMKNDVFKDHKNTHLRNSNSIEV